MNLSQLNRESDWSAIKVQVLGLGIAGFAMADNLRFIGAEVIACDSNDSTDLQNKAKLLSQLDVTVHLGSPLVLEPEINLLAVSPGFSPNHPVILEALAAGIEVWGELEIAWRLRGPNAAPWLCVTGTNGKTTTTLMLESMLKSAGLRTVAAGNIGLSLVEVVMDQEPYDVIAVEVGAPQLPFVHTVSAHSAVCLNLAEDHVDLFGSFAAYVAAKARLFERAQHTIVFNSADEATLKLAEAADVIEGCRAVGFTLEVPQVGELGVVEEFLIDRAFGSDIRSEATELAYVDDVQPFARHNVQNALAAAALARSYGVLPSAIRAGLQAFEPAAHRVAEVATINGVRFVDDSKATNCHAAQTAISSYDKVVWIAGGDAKGQDFSQLVQAVRERLAAVVLLGRDRELIGSQLAIHAPEVPVLEVSDLAPEAMTEVVAKAAAVAQSGSVVLLAPACASWDMYRNYGHRGDLFVQAVESLAQL